MQTQVQENWSISCAFVLLTWTRLYNACVASEKQTLLSLPSLPISQIWHHLIGWFLCVQVKGRPQRKFSFPPKDISLTIELPLQFNLQINAADDADVHISNFEGGWIYDIAIDKGDCYLSNLKSTDLHVKSSHGNIISKSHLLAEFGTLTVENAGMISVEKLQGRKFCLDSESGTISTGPLYLQRGEVSSQTGSVSLGDIHGEEWNTFTVKPTYGPLPITFPQSTQALVVRKVVSAIWWIALFTFSVSRATCINGYHWIAMESL